MIFKNNIRYFRYNTLSEHLKAYNGTTQASDMRVVEINLFEYLRIKFEKNLLKIKGRLLPDER